MDDGKAVTRSSKQKNEKNEEKNVNKNLENWTLLADCNWGEREKSNIVTVKNLNLNSRSSDDIGEKDGCIQILHMFEFWSSSYSFRLVNTNKKDVSMDIYDIKNRNSPNSSINSENKLKFLNLYDDLELDSVIPHCAKIYAFRLYTPSLFNPSCR
jgi:hypothetical protein